MVTSVEYEKYRKNPLPFNVATLHKNASGVTLTYRGVGVLPQLNGSVVKGKKKKNKSKVNS